LHNATFQWTGKPPIERLTYDSQGRLVTVTATSNGQPAVVLTTQYADDSQQRSSLSATIDGLADFLTSYQYLCPCQLARVVFLDCRDFDTAAFFCGTAEKRLAGGAGGGNELPCSSAGGR